MIVTAATRARSTTVVVGDIDNLMGTKVKGVGLELGQLSDYRLHCTQNTNAASFSLHIGEQPSSFPVPERPINKHDQAGSYQETDQDFDVGLYDHDRWILLLWQLKLSIE